MYIKFIYFTSVLTVASAQLSAYATGNIDEHHKHAVSSQSPLLHQTHGQILQSNHQPINSHHEEEHYAPPHYSFGYNVHDPHTGDIKSQHETREGNVVRGYYSLLEPDGSTRRVEYTVDKYSGCGREERRGSQFLNIQSVVILAAAFATVASAQLSIHGIELGHNQEYGLSVSSHNSVLHQNQGHESQSVHQTGHEAHQELETDPEYAFEYSVHDTETGDIKTQHETSDGDVVHGFYMLHEADGTVRRVEYTADKHNGFKAIVRHERHARMAPSHQTHEVPAYHNLRSHNL